MPPKTQTEYMEKEEIIKGSTHYKRRSHNPKNVTIYHKEQVKYGNAVKIGLETNKGEE